MRLLQGMQWRPSRAFAWVMIIYTVLSSLYKQWWTLKIAWVPDKAVQAAFNVDRNASTQNVTLPNALAHQQQPVTALRNASATAPKALPNQLLSDESLDNSLVWGARSQTGTLGYKADPTALQRERQGFLDGFGGGGPQVLDIVADYWKTLAWFQNETRQGTLTERTSLSAESVCGLGPGRGLEEEGGFKLLTEKIRVADDDNDNVESPVRILCVIYTHNMTHDLARTSALSYGYKCDGFLAFTTETVPALGMVNLMHAGTESYHNMWQKVRSLWAYIHHFYRNDYDYFHLGGDDMYVIVENLRRFLTRFENQTAQGEPVYLGQWIRQKHGYYVAGGPGYTVNRAALERFVNDALSTCNVHTKASYEDRLFSSCMTRLGIRGGDTRDFNTGEQQYHDCSPHCLFISRAASGRRASFHSRAVAYWETLPHPDQVQHFNETVGSKHNLEAAAVHSVSLHKLHHPLYLARVHSIIFPDTCPPASPLGRGLRAHSAWPLN